MRFYNWICLLLLIPAIWMNIELNEKVQVQGTIIGMNKDQVKAGKNGARDRFLVAVQYNDRPSDTIEVPLHYYVETKVGDSIQHSVRTINPQLESLFVICGAILLSLGIVLGLLPLLLEMYYIMKTFKSKYPDDF